MAYLLRTALGKLPASDTSFSLYLNGSNKELVIGAVPAADLQIIEAKPGFKKPTAQGKCRWSGNKAVVTFRFTKGSSATAQDTIEKLCKGNGAPVVRFEIPPPVNANGGNNVPLPTPTGQGRPLPPTPGQGRPLPPIPTNQTPPPVPPRVQPTQTSPTPPPGTPPPLPPRPGTSGDTQPNVAGSNRPLPPTPPRTPPPLPPRPGTSGGATSPSVPQPAQGQSTDSTPQPDPDTQDTTTQSQQAAQNPATQTPSPTTDQSTADDTADDAAKDTDTTTDTGANPPPSTPLKGNNVGDHYVPPMPDPPNLSWLRSVGTPRPPEPVDLKKKFNAKRMALLKAETSRGFFKGQGDFKSVVRTVDDLLRVQTVMEDFQKSRPGPLEAKVLAKLLARYNDLLAKLRKYENNFNEDGTARKFGVSSRQQGSSAIRDTKLDFTEEVFVAALQTSLQLLGQNAADGTLTANQERQYHEARAEYILRSSDNGAETAQGEGTSTTRLLRNPDGSVAYAFKTLDGESELMMKNGGLPPGAGTAQEVLSSKLSEVLQLLCDFSSGTPKTTLATLPVGASGDAKANFGALITGLPGKPINPKFDIGEQNAAENSWTGEKGATPLPDNEKAAILQRAQNRKNADGSAFVWNPAKPGVSYRRLLMDEMLDPIRNVPAEDMQRILLMNLASVNFDSKWTNVMMDGNSVQPFDGGGSMFSAPLLAKNVMRSDPLGSRMLRLPDPSDPEADLVSNPDTNEFAEHPAANARLHLDFVKKFASLNLDQVRTEMNNAVAEMQAADPTADKTLASAVSIDNVESSILSLGFMKAAILENTNATTKEFLASYNAKMMAWAASYVPPATTGGRK